MSQGFNQLQDVIADPDFPALDLSLRRGRHVDRDDSAWYALLIEAQEQLEAFYRRYGCELIHKSDGYFFLLPTSDQLPRRQLSTTDMLVGQALALLYLDPASIERGGLVTREQVIEQLISALGSDTLLAAFLPKRKRQDEQLAQRLVRAKIGEALRRLAQLGFAETSTEEQIRLRPALLRFAEPVRDLAEPAAALAQLLAHGEVALADALETNDAPDEAESGDEVLDDEAAV
jgi:chromosome partition protein MukE